MKTRTKILCTIFSFLVLTPSPLVFHASGSQKVQDLVSLIKNHSGLELQLDDVGWTWKEEDIKGTIEAGEITFFDSKWLMYLVHWGPVQVPEITVDYVKKRMLDMWGVKFEFTGKEGTTEVAGHKAVWVEAYGTNRMFQTRFFVWNCLESQREFIADTNFNIRLKTPPEDFETEMRSALTVRCHTGAEAAEFPDLTQKYESRDYGLSFDLPERWFVFESPYYVPFPQYAGIRGEKMGSLLALCSDQNISVTLKWGPPEIDENQLAFMGLDQIKMVALSQQIESIKDIDSFRNHGMEGFSQNGHQINRIWGTCRFVEPENENEKVFYTGEGLFQVAQWNMPELSKTITLILISKQYRHGTSVSSPTRHSLDLALGILIRQIQKNPSIE